MSLLILILPLVSFLITSVMSYYVFKNNNKVLNFLSWLTSILLLGVSFVTAFFMLLQVVKSENPIVVHLFDWFTSGNIYINLSVYFDVLTLVMSTLVCFISLLVHIYSYFYMSRDENLARFLSYLSLFTCSMIFLVTSSNLMQMFIGWEAISFCSYLLIVFWHNEDEPVRASTKTFIINRFADIAFILAMFTTLSLFGSLNFVDIFKSLPTLASKTFSVLDFEIPLINLICILFTIAAFTKSAQIGFHIWLPEAMEAPTPVSALLHAATMVTAGIFLIVKLSPLFEIYNFSANIILVVSGFTALYSAIVACKQNDIKKIIAYSTISQLSYMFLAIGVGSYNAAVFHLVNHAFFKALLFLSAGAIIHFMSGEQNVKKMGNLWRKMPVVYVCMWIASLALIGFPGFSGYYSKELILDLLHNNSDNGYVLFAYYCAIAGIFFTTFYSLRLILYVFHGKEEEKQIYHHNSLGMSFILVILAVLSVLSGKFLFENFVGENVISFWKNSIFIADEVNHNETETNVGLYSLIIIACSTIIAYILYIRDRSFVNKLASTFPLLNNFLFKGMYIDWIYDVLMVRFFRFFSKSLGKFDDKVLDQYGPNTVAGLTFRLSKLFNKTQNGYLNVYAIVMLVGFLMLLTYCFIIFRV